MGAAVRAARDRASAAQRGGALSRHEVDGDEAARGIYFDFEGFRSGTPSMAGTLIGEDYTPIFLHPTFQPVADHLGTPLTTLEDYAALLARKAEREERMLFAYSIHEAEVFVHEVPHYAEALADRFVNAQTVVRKWSNREGLGLPRGERSLKAYYERFFEPYPERFKKMSVPRRLGRIAAACKRHGTWDRVPPKTRGILDDLLDYNRLDCHATRALVLRATRTG